MLTETEPTTHTVESDMLSLAQHDEVLAVSAAGNFSSAQLYFIGPDDWMNGSIAIRLYGGSAAGACSSP
jgi:hypothetical protein